MLIRMHWDFNEPIQLENCAGILGIKDDVPSFVPANKVLLSERGIQYSHTDRSGLVFDCDRGLLVQSFFNGFAELPEDYEKNEVSDSYENHLMEMAKKGWGGGLTVIRSTTIPKIEVPFFFVPVFRVKKTEDIERLKKAFEQLPPFLSSVKYGMYINFSEVSKDLDIEALKELSKIESMLLIVKVATSGEELFNSLERTGKTQIYLLLGAGLLTDRTVIVGGDWITGADAEAIRSQSSWIVNMPVITAETGSGGGFPILKFFNKGYKRVILGTGSSFKDSPLFLSAFSLLLYRQMAWTSNISEERILRMLWDGWGILDEKMKCIDEGCYPPLNLYHFHANSSNIIKSVARGEYSSFPSFSCLPKFGCFEMTSSPP